MDTPFDLSLDDAVKRNNRERGRRQVWTRRGRGHGPGRSFGGGRMTGPARRGPLSINSRPSAYTIVKPQRRTNSFPWKYDLFQDSLRAAGLPRIENGTKLHISNLDYGVSKDDIKELFCDIGDLERFAIHYNRNGHPSGSAEVVYKRRSDAFAAMRRYNNVMLDGKLMRIEVDNASAEIPISARVNVTGMNGRRKRTVTMTLGPNCRGGFATGSPDSGQSWRGGMRNGGDKGRRGRTNGTTRGRGMKKITKKSADELDKDLDSYHAEAMQI